VAEPTTTTAGGVSLTVLFVAVLGPMAGPYVLIVLCAIAGAMWPLTAAQTASYREGAWLLLRCAALALAGTGVIAWAIERQLGVPVSESTGVIALLIGAMGNGWGPVFQMLSQTVQRVVKQRGEGIQ
jgi:hypothetical protein